MNLPLKAGAVLVVLAAFMDLMAYQSYEFLASMLFLAGVILLIAGGLEFRRAERPGLRTKSVGTGMVALGAYLVLWAVLEFRPGLYMVAGVWGGLATILVAIGVLLWIPKRSLGHSSGTSVLPSPSS